MKNIKKLTMAILLVISVLGVSFVLGQTDTPNKTVFQPTFNAEDKVVTTNGDTLWGYADSDYNRIIALNPQLNLKKVVRGPGDVYVLLPTGVEVKGVKRVAATATISTPTPSPTPSPSPTASVAGSSFFSFDPLLLLALLALALLLGLAYAIFVIWFSRNRRGAANAGPRYEQSGLNDRTATDAFQRHYANPNRGVGPTFTVQNLRRRRASGAITVAYNNGTSDTRVLENEVVYVADLHYSDGKVRRDEMLLSACGNPLRYGNVLSYAPGLGFRFVDEAPRYIQPVTEEQNANNAATTAAAQTSVSFNGGTAVITTNGKTLEVSADENSTFSKVDSEGENSPSAIQMRKNGVRLVIRDGALVEVEAETTPLMRILGIGLTDLSEILKEEPGTAETETAETATGEVAQTAKVGSTNGMPGDVNFEGSGH